MRELTYLPNGARQGHHGSARYSVTGGLPWYKETTAAYPDANSAWQGAIDWARAYEAKDRFGNMASALGVIRVENGWRGVVNYYHSNT